MMRPTPRPISEPIEIRPVRARTGLRRTGLRGAALRIVALMLLVGTTACGGPTAPDAPDPDPDPAPPGSGSGEGGIALEQVAEGFVRPLGVVAAGAELYVLEQGGTVRVVEEDGTVRAEPFLDLRNHDFVFPDGEPETSRDERGLLGMAFRSGGTSEVFVHYNDAVGDTVVARMDVAGDEVPVADPGTEEELLTVPQDPDSLNHRGGQLAFGPDGMLYVALGDGGTGGDPATTPADRRGSILRLDPDAPANAYVPTDGENPFVDDPEGDPYVWHYGLRNPWRFSFDDGAETARMWIADVGQNRVEEVNVVAAGDGGHDFGWNTWEGDLCYPDPEGPCDPTGTTAPVLTYEADEESRKSITGGYVYRGTAVPALEDRYVFGDFVDGTIRAATTPEDGGVEHEVLLETEAAISSFGLDADGEILVLDYVGGVLYRIVAD